MRKSDSILAANVPLLVALLLLWPAQWLVQQSGLLDTYAQRIIMLVGITITAAISLQLINGISGQFSLGHAGFMAVGAYLSAYPSLHYSQQLAHPVSVLAFYVALGVSAAAVALVIYGLYLAVRSSGRLASWAPLLLCCVLLAWIFTDLALSPADEVVVGAGPEGGMRFYVWTWLGQHVPAMHGWLCDALMPRAEAISGLFPQPAAKAMCYLVLLAGGGACAAAAGLIVGVPCLRLRGDYLAIATLGFAEIIRVLLEASVPLGRSLGLTDIPKVDSLAWVYGIALLATAAVWRLMRSARGRAMLAVREDEIAAASVGIDPARSKVLAFVVGAFLAGVAGVALVHFEGFATPANFNFMRSVELVVIITLAGSGSISGTILVAALLTWLPEELRGFSEYRMILYSALLIVMMLLRPGGLLAGRELLPGWRRRPHGAA